MRSGRLFSEDQKNRIIPPQTKRDFGCFSVPAIDGVDSDGSVFRVKLFRDPCAGTEKNREIQICRLSGRIGNEIKIRPVSASCNL